MLHPIKIEKKNIWPGKSWDNILFASCNYSFIFSILTKVMELAAMIGAYRAGMAVVPRHGKLSPSI